MKKFLFILFLIIITNTIAMENKPSHHQSNGTFKNPEGSPERSGKVKWSWSTFNKEKKKLDGPKRYVDPALSLKEIPKVDLFLLTHNHYDHQDTATIRKFPYKDANVIVPLKLGKYFTKYNYKKVNELDWFQTIQVNDLKITLLPAVHWSKRSLTDTNKTLWGNFLIEYKNKKILFACDTGYGQIYKKLGEKFGPVDLTMINIGAYDFRPMFEKSIYHTNPEEALQVAKDLKSRKVIGTHWGTFVLSLEPIMEPPVRFKNNAENYGFQKKDAIIFKIGEIRPLQEILD